MVRLRSFGKYSFRVVDSPLLLNTLVGTQGKYTTEEVASFLKDMIVARLADLLGTLKISLLDLPAKYDEVASGTRAKVAEEFASTAWSWSTSSSTPSPRPRKCRRRSTPAARWAPSAT